MNIYIAPTHQLLQIHNEGYERLYTLRNIDIKALACLAKSLNTTLEISGVPEFNKDDVKRLCEIPDYCFESPKLKPYEVSITDNRTVVEEFETL